MSSERIEAFHRDATDKDVLRVMKGEIVEARFRDDVGEIWTGGSRLGGWVKASYLPWLDECRSGWAFCQVYDPPQWFLDKPEPGEGYRLLGKFPDEALQPGDDLFLETKGWVTSERACVGLCQVQSSWYRRKIEQPKPEPKFAVGQRVRVVGPPIKGEGPIYNWCVEMDKYIGAVEFVRSQPQQTFEGVFFQVSNIPNWSFREDYLEAVVEPEPEHYVLQVGDTADVPSGLRIKITEHGIEVQ